MHQEKLPHTEQASYREERRHPEKALHQEELPHPGEMVRKIRLAKGYSQKEIYVGIVSKSFAILFEQGKASLNYADLLQVLKRLSLRHEEFEFIRHGYRYPEDISLWRTFALAANANQTEQMESIYQTLKASKSDFQRVIAYTAHALLREQKESTTHKGSEGFGEYCAENQFLTRYLLTRESWTLEEIGLFTSYFYLFEPYTQSILMQTCYKHLLLYADYSSYGERMYNLLINYISHCYLNHRRLEGDKWFYQLEQLKQSHQRNEAVMYQLVHSRMCEAYRHAAYGRIREGKEIAAQCSSFLEFLGFHEKARTILLTIEKAAAAQHEQGFNT